MKTFGEITRLVGKFAADNSPTILTTIGAVGTITTAYLTGRATYKAAEIIEDAKANQPVLYGTQNIIVPPKEFIKRTWKLYIPAALSAGLTIGAIICANRIGLRRTAALATAFSISERALQEYKQKVVETIGENKERAIRDEIAQDQVARNNSYQGVMIGTGEVLCLEAFTGRYFPCSMQKLQQAEIFINQMIISHNYAMLDDFYERVGLGVTSMSRVLGWDTGRMMKLTFSSTLTNDGNPCLVFDYDKSTPLER